MADDDSENPLNNIEVEETPVRPVRELQTETIYRRIHHNAKNLTSLDKNVTSRINALRHEQQEQFQGLQTMLANVNSQLQSLQPRPASRVGSAVGHRENLSQPGSANTSGFPSRMGSRNVSPAREQGMLPLMQNMVYGQKVLLKKKEDKLPEALAGLRKYHEEPNAVYRRMKNDTQQVADQVKTEVKSDMANMLKDSLGISSIDGIDHLTFYPIPEAEASETVATNARKDVQKECSKVSGSGENLRYLIEALVTRYNGKLSESQFKDAVISGCTGAFKDTIKNAFRKNDLNKAIKFIVKMYGNVQTPDEKITAFYRLKVDPKNYGASLRKIMEAALNCWPYEDENQITDRAIAQAFSHLPDYITKPISKIRIKIDSARKNNDEIEPLDYNQFMDLVQQYVKESEATKKIVKNVTAEASPKHDHEVTKNLDTLQQVQGQLVAAVSALTDKVSGLKPNLNQASFVRQPTVNDLSKKKGWRVKGLQLGSQEFDQAARQMASQGTLEQVIHKGNLYNHQHRKKERLQLKTDSDPYKPVPYKWDSNGRYIPTNNPIDYSPILETAPGRFVLSDKILRRVSEACLKCGEVACSSSNVNCVYANAPNSWTYCDICRQGFHKRESCLASTITLN